MESRWNDAEFKACGGDPLAERVFTSRLIGADPDLVLHGGGNTSVKVKITDFFGELEEVLYVKGSGWDLATIESPGFAPVRMSTLLKLAQFETLSDSDMVRQQRAAMLDPNAPNPSVEAILHALIPFKFVDHTHADAVVTVTNTPGGEDRVREIWGDRIVVVPYVMPGFVLAQEVARITRDVDWSTIEGMVLMNHGIFTFADDAHTSYERMIRLVGEAETHLRDNKAWDVPVGEAGDFDLRSLSRLRREVSRLAGRPMLARADNSSEARGFADREDVAAIATRGPLTPDHVIRTKRIPLVVNAPDVEVVADYARDYGDYFEAHATEDLTCLDPAPRWAVCPGSGLVSFGKSMKDAGIVRDITRHTIRAIQQAELLGGWQALPADKIFEVEYWELEQAKLKKSGSAPEFSGKVALVTGAASGIGKACAETLRARGAAVAALDLDGEVVGMFSGSESLGLVCDVTDPEAVRQAVASTVATFGGLDIVVSNAGIFPASAEIADMEDETWSLSLDLNLSSHLRLLKTCIPYLKNGLDPAVVIIGSKNVPAPGPGASAYSVAKAGLFQLARVAALELSRSGIRVNTLHPNAVFDTAIWTPEVLEKRAAAYGLSVEDYKTNNLLKTEVSSNDVGALACAMAGPLFAKTTGAAIPVDGGNERVI